MKKELLFSITKKDFDISWFSGKGAGGQHRNKHQNCCRIKHRDSGASGTGQSEKSQIQNKKQAFLNCINSNKFQIYLRQRIGTETISTLDLEKQVEELIKEENLLIETYNENKQEWVKLDGSW